MHLDPGVPEMAWVTMVSTSGGVLQGDGLDVEIAVDGGARLHVDTASATRIYRMPDGSANSRFRLRVESGAFLELLPDPNLPFAGSDFRQETECVVGEGGVLALAEIVGPGRQASGECFRYRSFESRTDVLRPDGRRVFRDVLRLRPDEGVDRLGMLGGHQALGTLFVVAPGAGPELFGAVSERPGVYAGASRLPGEAGAWLRVLAPDTGPAVATVREAWSAARQRLLGAPLPQLRRY